MYLVDEESGGGKSRYKRQSTNQLYLEYLVCVDYANFVV